MENSLFQSVYNPDVLSCIANLSNDEVFTPPELANKIIDMLPQELFENPDTTFLDPCCKSGVFLREIAKRLIKGLEPQIPDLEKRLEHIFSRQLFGIAITELTSLLSRRSVYCSKYPSSEWSAYQFPEDKPQGNIIYQRIKHTWSAGKCIYCGASQSEYERGTELETYAYQFIHNLDVKKLFNMKFDVIIGNPPYQLSDGSGGNGTSAIPLYQLFVENAKKISARFITMIIPSRWFSGGRGLDSFRETMLADRRIRNITDYFNSEECFPGIDLSGGVCYFLWERDYCGDCTVKSIRNNASSELNRPLIESGCDSFIRFNEAVSIIRKVKSFDEKLLIDIVSPSKPYGMRSNFDKFKKERTPMCNIKLYRYGDDGFINIEQVTSNKESVGKFKVYMAKAYGERGDFPYLVLGKPFLGEPNSCCTETYLFIGSFENGNDANNLISYIKTKFFRFLVLQKKNTQNASSKVYSYVPIQDFSKPWTDEELYAKYGLNEEEIAFIESMIRPME